MPLRFDERSLATVRTRLRDLADPLARALCWAGLWDACRDAELPAASFVEAVLTGVDGESDPALVETLLGQARTAATSYSTDGGDLLNRLAEASWEAAIQSPPGSDRQLVRTRACARVANGPSQIGRLAAVLAGIHVPDGLVVDTDLRWAFVQALAVAGRLDDADIEAELARDPTAAGQLRALTARASRPDAAAKERAWRAATTDLSLSNHQSAAVAAGIWQHGQDELLSSYVDRYAAELPTVWATRSPQVAGSLSVRLFPATLVDPFVLQHTASLLDERQPAGLRRYVAEQRDDLARALAARGVSGPPAG